MCKEDRMIVAIIVKGIIFLFLVASVSMLCTAIYNLIFCDQIGPFDVVAELFAVEDEETDYVIID